jgi:hypothetical protein
MHGQGWQEWALCSTALIVRACTCHSYMLHVVTLLCCKPLIAVHCAIMELLPL